MNDDILCAFMFFLMLCGFMGIYEVAHFGSTFKLFLFGKRMGGRHSNLSDGEGDLDELGIIKS